VWAIISPTFTRVGKSKSSRSKHQNKETTTPRLCLLVNKQPLEVEVRHAQDLKLKQFTDGNDKRADRVHYNESDFDYPELKVKD
jgi:hypothetical protein